jgi:hypothetical protein
MAEQRRTMAATGVVLPFLPALTCVKTPFASTLASSIASEKAAPAGQRDRETNEGRAP